MPLVWRGRSAQAGGSCLPEAASCRRKTGPCWPCMWYVGPKATYGFVGLVMCGALS